MSEAFYDPEKDKDTLEKLNTSKNITLLGFTKLFKIIMWIITIYGLLCSFALATIVGAWLTIPFTIIAVIICGSILAIYLAFYLPGAFTALVMTFLDPAMETREEESLTTIATRIILNSALGWIYVEKKLTGTSYSTIIFA